MHSGFAASGAISFWPSCKLIAKRGRLVISCLAVSDGSISGWIRAHASRPALSLETSWPVHGGTPRAFEWDFIKIRRWRARLCKPSSDTTLDLLILPELEFQRTHIFRYSDLSPKPCGLVSKAMQNAIGISSTYHFRGKTVLQGFVVRRFATSDNDWMKRHSR